MIIKSFAELKNVVEINQGSKYNSIKPSLEIAENTYLIPVIGNAYYNYLNTLHNQGTVTGIHLRILELCQKVVASMAMVNYIPITDVQISDIGITNANSGDTKAAYKYQVLNAILSYTQRGFQFIEELITLLEDNVSTLTLWTNSNEFKKYRSLFIQSGADFKDYFNKTANPRLLYQMMVPTMQDVELFTIKPIITDIIFDSFKTKLAQPSPTLSDVEKKLLQLIKKATVYFTIYEAVPLINVKVDENGITVLSQSVDQTANEMGKRAVASDNHISLLRSSMYNMGMRYLDECVSFLNKNSSPNLWPEWYNNMSTMEQQKCNSTYTSSIFSL